MTEKETQVRLIVEQAMTELKLAGLDHDGAATLLAIQGSIRIGDRAKLEEVASFIDETLDPRDVPVDEHEEDEEERQLQ